MSASDLLESMTEGVTVEDESAGLGPDAAPSRAEVLIGWIPQHASCAAHLFVDEKHVVAAHSKGGRLILSVLEDDYSANKKLTLIARFFAPGWKCQVYVRFKDKNGAVISSHKIYQAEDPDPSNPNDDRIKCSVTLP